MKSNNRVRRGLAVAMAAGALAAPAASAAPRRTALPRVKDIEPSSQPAPCASFR